MLKLTIEGNSNYIQAVSNFLINLDENGNKVSVENPKKPKEEISKKEDTKKEAIVEEAMDNTIDQKDDSGVYTMDKLDDIFRQTVHTRSNKKAVKEMLTSYNTEKFTVLKEFISRGEVSIKEVGDKLTKILGGLQE